MSKKGNIITLLIVILGLSLLTLARLGPDENQASPLDIQGSPMVSNEAIKPLAPDFGLPEFPMGSIAGLLAFMFAFMVYAAKGRRKFSHS